MGKSLDDVLGHVPLPEPDPPEVAEQHVERYVQEVEREAIESEMARPPASARRTLKARIDEDADALADHAVSEALTTKGAAAVKSVKALIDTADAAETTVIPSTVEEVERMTFVELVGAVAVLAPEKLSERDWRILANERQRR